MKIIEKMIGAQWLKHSPRVKFKRLVWGPHTDISDGGMDPKDSTAISFAKLVQHNFLKFFRKRSKKVFIIWEWKYKSEAVQNELLQQLITPFSEILMQTCNREKLATQTAITSTKEQTFSQWIFKVQLRNSQNRSFIIDVIGPFEDQLQLQGRIIGSEDLNAKEILGTVLSIFHTYRFLIDRETDIWEETIGNQSTVVIENHVGTSILKLLDVVLLGGRYSKAIRKKRNKKDRRRRRKEKREKMQKKLETKKANRKKETQRLGKSQLEAKISNSSIDTEKLTVADTRSKSHSEISEEEIQGSTEKVVSEKRIVPYNF
jgi:hypothetical protein